MLYDPLLEICHRWEGIPLSREKTSLPQLCRGHPLLIDNHIRLPKGMTYKRFNSRKKCIGYRVYNCAAHPRAIVVHLPVVSPRQRRRQADMQDEFFRHLRARTRRKYRADVYVILTAKLPGDVVRTLMTWTM